MDAKLSIHSFVELSEANGPGRRCVLWLQGCSLSCPGCFNPETHTFAEAKIGVDELVGRILRTADLLGLEGVTISGGEPFEQAPGLAELLRLIKERSLLSIVVFTGFEYDELQKNSAFKAMCSHIDVLIAGRFEVRKRLASGLRGSSNKSFQFLSRRYCEDDFVSVPPAEVIISALGEITLTGIDPVKMR